jgi:hypothetical protein
MNQVPWRRILERAEGGPPSEGGAAIINLHDHVPERHRSRRRPEQHPEDSAELENELKHALRRAEHGGHERNTAGAPAGWDPIHDEHAGRMRVPLQRSVARAETPAKTGSGGRNLLALALSVSVIAVAFYQISDQWSAAQNGAQDADSRVGPQASATAAFYRGADDRTAKPGADTDAAAQRAPFAGNRIDLRPSLAGDSGSARAPAGKETRQVALEREIREAASLISQAEQSRANAALAADGASATEQTMLRRGHQMLAQGHIAGARLVFEHLAEQNSALGAFALAQTYDPNFLDSRQIKGAQADRPLAAKWYQRAAQLTETQAPR